MIVDLPVILLTTAAADRLVHIARSAVAYRSAAGASDRRRQRGSLRSQLRLLRRGYRPVDRVMPSGERTLPQCSRRDLGSSPPASCARTMKKTRMIFGDGAAAFFLEHPQENGNGHWQILSALVGADGSGAGLFCVPERAVRPSTRNVIRKLVPSSWMAKRSSVSGFPGEQT